MYWWDGPAGVGSWIGMSLMVIVWVAVIVGAVYLVRHLSSRQGSGTDHGAQVNQAAGAMGERPTALHILEERYARGEIDREEFLQRKEDLRD